MDLNDLDTEARLRLVGFLCSFAWADLEVQEAERTFVTRVLDQLGLDAEERSQAERWLAVPPAPEEVDPTDIPEDQRQIFLSTMLQLVGADGNVSPAEMETLALFEKLLRPPGLDEDPTTWS
jgi:uncharacterized tellurite resistance protein B-like protein